MKSLFGGKFLWLWISIFLMVCAMVYRNFSIVQQNTPEKNAKTVTHKLSKEISTDQQDLERLKQVILQNTSESFGSMLIETKYPYYIFQNRRIVFWSDNDFTPNYQDVIGVYKTGYIETVRGKYIVQKELFKSDLRNYEIVMLIDLTKEFSIVNQYLKNTYNKEIFTDVNFEIHALTDDDEYQTISLGEEQLFSVKFGNTYANSQFAQRLILVLFILLSLGSLIVFVYKQLEIYVAEGSIFYGFFFLISSIIAIRSLMLLTGFPFNFVLIDVFDPRHYASSLVNPSLGDLMLNLISLLLIGLYVFNHFLSPSIVRTVKEKNDKSKLLISIVCFFFSFFWLAVHHQTMKTLNFDSQWTMDITQKLEFDYLKTIGYSLFFISVIIYFLFAHVCFRLFHLIHRQPSLRFYFSIVAGMALFVGFAFLLEWDFLVVAIVNLVYFLVVMVFSLHQYLSRLQYLTFIYIFSFGLPGALIGVYANIQFNQSRIDYDMSRIANQLLVERNFFTEIQLAEVANMIKEDIFIQKRIISPYGSKLLIEKKIRREFLQNLDKFDIQIHVFNSRGEPFGQDSLTDNYHNYKSKLHTFETDTEGLYFVNPGPGQATTRYLSFIEIEYRNQIIGYIILDLRQKRQVPNSVFPLLINEGLYNQQIENSDRYSYSVFINKQLQYSSGEFNYRKNMPEIAQSPEDIFDKSIVIKGYAHRAYLGENDRFVIISAEEPSLNQRYANFSFLFLVFVFSILLILISIAIYQSIQHIKLNYAAKIQLYLNFAFFTPLIIVSITTVSIIIQTFKTSLENQYLEYADNLSTLIADPLDDFRQLIIDREPLSDEIFRIAEVADVDINVFHTNGRLLASSLFQIYQNNILSYNIEPNAYIRIFENQESAFVLEEMVGSLKFKNAYIAVRSSETGAIIGILSLPFFASQTDLEHRVIDVLSSIMNIFTFLFIIFLFVSFFVSRGLTFPLSLITQKIKRTTLSSFNEPLSWNSDDEIGLMVAEYNRMLVNLEESKKALAKSEKESAWREMARQVAHEIKNPLTPMKLTLQHMKRIIDDNGENDKDSEKKQKQINSLLEQIETLSDIATSFSDFAKMPVPKNESLDIRSLLLETIELYNKQELGEIITAIEEGKFKIEGDKKWLGRAFSNLIINGFQAVSDQHAAKLSIRLYRKDNKKVVIEIEDNGVGIPAHIGEKVFTPNFSTKYTGSGLGLAITKKGIEHANGKIWFTTKEAEGTIFYIEIPLT